LNTPAPWLHGRPRARWVTMAVAAVLMSWTQPAATLATPGTVPPGMLPVGTYPLFVYDTGKSSNYQPAGSPPPSLVVSTGEGSYTQASNFSPGSVEVTLVAPNPPLAPLGIYLKQLKIHGLTFTPAQPVVYRPVNVLGEPVPLQSWRWTVRSDDGRVELTQSSVVEVPSVEMSRSSSVLVRRVNTTLTFSGVATGQLNLTQWEAVRDPTRMRLHSEGEITVLGQRYPVNTTAVLGGLD
jgi:hypothetical protein